MNKIASILTGLALVATASIAPAMAQIAPFTPGTFTFPGPGTFTFNVSPTSGLIPLTVIPVTFNALNDGISTGFLTLSGGTKAYGGPGVAGTYTSVTEFFAPDAGQNLGPFSDVGTVFISQRSATTFDLASDTTTFTASGTSFDLVPGTPGTPGTPGAPVPEASTTASFGLLLALSLGGLAVAAKRKKAASSL